MQNATNSAILVELHYSNKSRQYWYKLEPFHHTNDAKPNCSVDFIFFFLGTREDIKKPGVLIFINGNTVVAAIDA
jgi:hypothetical protein